MVDPEGTDVTVVAWQQLAINGLGTVGRRRHVMALLNGPRSRVKPRASEAYEDCRSVFSKRHHASTEL